MDLLEEINSVNWHCSQHVCKHQYILQKEQPELFKHLSDALRSSTFSEKYRKFKYTVVFIMGIKYWRMGDVINRKPMTEEEAGKIAREETYLGEVKI